jgi:hypothetical protein
VMVGVWALDAIHMDNIGTIIAVMRRTCLIDMDQLRLVLRNFI